MNVISLYVVSYNIIFYLLKGVFGDGKFNMLDDVIKICTTTIFMASVQHTAANFCQYHEYAFPPFYRIFISGKPPTNKVN